MNDTAEIVSILQSRFREIVGPVKEDICYATTNRQEAVKAIAERCDGMVVIGAPNSSNSKRLVEVAMGCGCDRALLIQRAADIDWEWMASISVLGITAGASAPEILVGEVVEACRAHRTVTIEEVAVAREDVHFKLPRALVS